MSETPEIYATMAAVMADVQAVAKQDKNTHQGFVFRGIDAVMNAVGPALRTHGVIVVPQVNQVDYADVQTSTGKPATACRVRVAYLFFASDGSYVETCVAGEAWDAGDKACPKAMSVAFRTALLQALCLPTDEPDPDSHTYERAANTAPAAPAPKPSPKQRIATKLEKSGVPLTAFRDFLGSQGFESWDAVPENQREAMADGIEKSILLDDVKQFVKEPTANGAQP